MKQSIICLSVVLVIFLSCSCEHKKQEYVTQRIQYDVTIKNPDPDFDWWIQNIEGMKREALINDLLEAAFRGEVKTYDPFSLSANSIEQVKNLVVRHETVRLQRDVEPFDHYDTVIQKGISIHEIMKIRFLEEWTMNRKGMTIDKNILGIALMAESYDNTGFLRGYMPLFWIFYDDAYPGKLKGIVE